MASITPGFLILLSILSLYLMAASREKKIIPIVVAMCFLPADISILIGGLNFQAVRILAIAGFLLTFGTSYSFKFNIIDKLFFLYNIIGAIAYVSASIYTSHAFIFQCGQLVDRLILYIVLRRLLQSKADIQTAIRTFTICIILLLPFVVYEFFSAQNLFAFVGREFISVRDGEIRAAATFSHSILFGSFAASLIPVLWGDYKDTQKKNRLLAICCCVFFIVASSSSGPIVVFLCSLIFLYMFQWKQYSKIISWMFFFCILIIHFIRESPIWHLLYVRLAVKASSTGFHRYLLTEAAIKEFSNWWFIGYGDAGPQWHVKYWPWTYATFTDMTNHYLLIGVRGGVLPMILFIVLCHKSITTLGRHSINSQNTREQWFWWGLSIMLICHCITFLSVAYFGQITMLLYFSFAIAAYVFNESRSGNISI